MFDLLFSETEKTLSSEAIDDMLFHELKDTVFTGQCGLYNCFVKVVSSPLTNANSILKRQRILKDLLMYPHLVNSMCEICKKVKDVKMENRKSIYQVIDALTRLKFNYQSVNKIFKHINDFGSLIKIYDFKSAELIEIKEYFCKLTTF